MQKFSFKAINENGETITDVVEAESIEMANSALLARGYIPTKVTPEKLISSKFGLSQILERFTPIGTPELILFTKQFRTLLRAGVSIINIFYSLSGTPSSCGYSNQPTGTVLRISISGI